LTQVLSVTPLSSQTDYIFTPPQDGSSNTRGNQGSHGDHPPEQHVRGTMGPQKKTDRSKGSTS